MSSVPAAPLRTHVLFESSGDGIPHGCSQIRLLRPLAHASVRAEISLTSGLELPDHAVDVIVVERLWSICTQRDVPVLSLHAKLLRHAAAQGARILFEMDDDLLYAGASAPCSEAQRMWIRRLLRSAHGAIVSTQHLAERCRHLTRQVEVVPNALDESLFLPSRHFQPRENNGIVVFGYMGTFTHLHDLLSILRPVRSLLARHSGRIRFEVVGVGDDSFVQTLFAGLPCQVRTVPPQAVAYERFVPWFQENIRWDFGIAPLVDSPFTRSKSDIKFLDYGICGIPGVFSKTQAYADTIMHEHTGLLASDLDEWDRSLSRIVEDVPLRLHMARNAHELAWRERTLATRAADFATAIRRLTSI